MTIPRRDLLTGGALVLAASVSGCGTGTPASQGSQPKPLRTQFMADFTAAFIGDPTKIKDPGQPDKWPDPAGRLWPTKGQKLIDVVADYATFVNVLMTVGYVGVPPAAAAPGSLGDRIAQFLQAQNWPTATPVVPTEYQGELPTVHLVEIAVILDRLLQAANSFGDGPTGGGSNWPPH
ncbi:MAG TPA: hypothetical protein VK466_15470 [Terriglobales bacterium]|nr:hypothetical protein [Terriglobales bacterium]